MINFTKDPCNICEWCWQEVIEHSQLDNFSQQRATDSKQFRLSIKQMPRRGHYNHTKIMVHPMVEMKPDRRGRRAYYLVFRYQLASRKSKDAFSFSDQLHRKGPAHKTTLNRLKWLDPSLEYIMPHRVKLLVGARIPT